MKYFIRLNGDDSLKVEANHSHSKHEYIKDTAMFDSELFKDPVCIIQTELLDEDGVLWALRRIPEEEQFIASDEYIIEIGWTLTFNPVITVKEKD